MVKSAKDQFYSDVSFRRSILDLNGYKSPIAFFPFSPGIIISGLPLKYCFTPLITSLNPKFSSSLITFSLHPQSNKYFDTKLNCTH